MLIVSKDNLQCTVELVKIDGELLEVRVPDKEKGFSVGDKVRLAYEKKAVETHILKREGNHLSLLLPLPYDVYPPGERRNFPRYEKKMNGIIAGPINHIMSSSLIANHFVQIVDVSAKGFGFITKSKLDKEGKYDIFTQDAELSLRATVIIRNVNKLEEGGPGYRYGVEIIDIDNMNQTKLRRFCLLQQLFSKKSNPAEETTG